MNAPKWFFALGVILSATVAVAGTSTRYLDRQQVVRDYQSGLIDRAQVAALMREGVLTFEDVRTILDGLPLSYRGRSPESRSSWPLQRLVRVPRVGLRDGFSDNFEGADLWTEVQLVGQSVDRWRLINFNNGTPASTVSLWCGPAGANDASAVYGPGTFAAAELNLTLPLSTLPANSPVTLSWRQDLKTSNDVEDFGRVEISSGAGAWQPLATYRSTNSNGWQTQTVSLTPWVGSDLRLRWVFFSDSDTLTDKGYFIDDISVSMPAASQDILATQTFTGTWDKNSPPGGWSILSNGVSTEDPSWRSFTSGRPSNTVALSPAVSASSYDEVLLSPVLDTTGLFTVTLAFTETARPLSDPVHYSVEVSSNNGASWTSVWGWDTAGNEETGDRVIDISAIASDKPQVRIRFRATGGDFIGEWLVDNVHVTSGSGTTILAEDDFESGDGRWKTYGLNGPGDLLHLVGNGRATVVYPDHFSVGYNSVGSRLFGDLNQSYDDGGGALATGQGAYLPAKYGNLPYEQAIVSQPIDLGSFTPGASVTMNIRNRRYGQFAAWHFEYSIDGGTTWLGQTEESPSNPSTVNVGDWELSSLLLTGAAGNSNVLVRFRMQVEFPEAPAYGYWFIDDVSIDFDATGPVIQHTGLLNTWSSQPRSLLVQAQDPSGVSGVTILYRYDAIQGFQGVQCTETAPGFFEGSIPPPTEGNRVEYYLVGTDGSSNISSLPTGGDFANTPASLFTYLYLPGDGEVLLAYDGVKTSLSALRTTLDAVGLAYDEFYSDQETVPPGALQDYNLVLWDDGSQLSADAMTAMSRFLRQGKHTGLFIAGDAIGQFNGASAFYRDDLRARFVQADPGSRKLLPAASDPVSLGLDITLAGAGLLPNEIDTDSTWPGASGVFTFDSAGYPDYDPQGSGTAAMKTVDVNFSAVYLGFPLAAISSQSDRTTLVRQALTWMKSKPAIPTPTPSSTPTSTPTRTPSLTPTPTNTPTPSNTPTPNPSPPTSTPTPTITPPASTSVALEAGWNTFALPFELPVQLTARGLLAYLQAGGIDARFIARFAAQEWSMVSYGVPQPDYPLVPGEGYFIYTSQAGTFNLGGTAFPAVPTVVFYDGWNLTGFPVEPTAPATARDICDHFPYPNISVLFVAGWEGGRYRVLDCSAGYGDFPITPERAYFVSVR